MVGVVVLDVPDALRVPTRRGRPVHRPVLGASRAQRNEGDRKGEDGGNAAEGAEGDVLPPEEVEEVEGVLLPEVVVREKNLLGVECLRLTQSRQGLLSWYQRSCHQDAAPCCR